MVFAEVPTDQWTAVNVPSSPTPSSKKPSADTFKKPYADTGGTPSHNLGGASSSTNFGHSDTAGSVHELAMPVSYPPHLIFFLCILAVLCGFVVIGVHLSITYSGCPLGLNGCNRFFGKEDKGFFLVRWVQDNFGDAVPEDVVYISASLVGALIFVAMMEWLPEALSSQISGGGTIQALVSVANGERIFLKAAALRIFASSVYLGTGGTLGMDGPAIQVCTAVTTFVGWCICLNSAATQSLLACLGFASGFAASFNSPLAGIMFAVEELEHVSTQISRHVICLIMMTSVVSTTVARLCLGHESLFDAGWGSEGLHKVFGTNMWMLSCVPIAIVCSLFGYLISLAFTNSWRWLDTASSRVHLRWLRVLLVVASAVIGSAAFRITGLRGVWGIGYESLQHVFDKDIPTSHYFAFAVCKALAMVAAVAAKCPGDILEPVLISGAFLGGGMGCLMELLLQDETHIVKPCVVFGMVSLFASCFRFPLTSVVIVLEFLGEETYALVLPTTMAAFTAITVSNKLFPPLLDLIMHNDGICLQEINEETFSDNNSSLHGSDEEDGDKQDIESSAAPSEYSVVSGASHSAMFRLGIQLENSIMSVASSPQPSRCTSRAPSGGSSSGGNRSGSPTRRGSRTLERNGSWTGSHRSQDRSLSGTSMTSSSHCNTITSLGLASALEGHYTSQKSSSALDVHYTSQKSASSQSSAVANLAVNFTAFNDHHAQEVKAQQRAVSSVAPQDTYVKVVGAKLFVMPHTLLQEPSSPRDKGVSFEQEAQTAISLDENRLPTYAAAVHAAIASSAVLPPSEIAGAPAPSAAAENNTASAASEDDRPVAQATMSERVASEDNAAQQTSVTGAPTSSPAPVADVASEGCEDERLAAQAAPPSAVGEGSPPESPSLIIAAVEAAAAPKLESID